MNAMMTVGYELLTAAYALGSVSMMVAWMGLAWVRR